MGEGRGNGGCRQAAGVYDVADQKESSPHPHHHLSGVIAGR